MATSILAHTVPQLVMDRNGEGLVHEAAGHSPECWDGGCSECQMHAESCECVRCALYWTERLGIPPTSNGNCLGDDCQGCTDCPDVPFGRPAAELLAEREAWKRKTWWNHLDKLLEYDLAAGHYFAKHTRPVTLSPLPQIRALLSRSDGETLLYQSKFNSLHGEPGCGKSWLALMVAVDVMRSGTKCVWWDHEDAPSTIASRLDALGAGDLIGSPLMHYVTPSLAEDEPAMVMLRRWLMRGDSPGLLVLDSAVASGAPSDGSDVGPWLQKYVQTWRDVGATLLVLDHVPKQKVDRPRGQIGSQRKLAAIDGAALYNFR